MEKTRTGSRRGCITRLSAGLRIESESDPLYSIEPIRPSPSFCVRCQFTSLVAPLLSPSSRASPLSSSTSTSRFSTRNVVPERTTTTSFVTDLSLSLSFSTFIYMYLLCDRSPLAEKAGESVRVATRERRMLWKSVLPSNSSGRKQCWVIDEKAQRFDVGKGLPTYVANYLYRVRGRTSVCVRECTVCDFTDIKINPIDLARRMPRIGESGITIFTFEFPTRKCTLSKFLFYLKQICNL